MSIINKKSTITDLRNELLESFGQLKAGKLDPEAMKELNNTAGKIISSAKTQLHYAELRKESPDIDFLR